MSDRARSEPVVAIDGPAGVGKSTAAREVARRLGYLLVDTGALYRAVALLAGERGVGWGDGEALARLVLESRIELGTDDRGATKLAVNGRDRSGEIRTPEISRGASAVSRHAAVRAALLGVQRELGADGGVVLEGRDIGTVVFPDAEVKVFLTAAPEVRARRRYDELAARGDPATYEETLAEVIARDRRDETRDVAPLRRARDAVEVDTSDMGVEEVVDRLIRLVRDRKGEPG